MDKARLRTAYDRRAIAGEVPFIPGGNPTPEEVQRQADEDAARPPRQRWQDRFPGPVNSDI